jgi:hypothetical protein
MTGPALTEQLEAMATDPSAAAETAPEPVYATLIAWVNDWLAAVVERRVRTKDKATRGVPARWCECWWDHPEAVSRLGSLWRAWEALRLDPATGMSVWWRDHFGAHWPDLVSETGPFALCSEEGQHLGPMAPLPMADPPPDWIPPVD